MRLGPTYIIILMVCAVARTAAAQEHVTSHHHGGAGATAGEDAVGGVISLDVCGQGANVHLLTATRAPGQPAVLQYLRSDDAGATFAEPVRIGADQPATIAKRGMDAQIAAAGARLVAVWPTAGTDKMGRGPMATALSSDGGRTWRAGPNPADDGLTIGHSFIDLAADAVGTFHLVWLDSREGGAKGLRYARSTDGGVSWSTNRTLDAETCECCWNVISCGAGGALAVLYRDAKPRDMAVVRSFDGGATWSSPPVPVGRFDWAITACPHVGGAIALAGDAMHALVWTARDNQTHGVYALNSADRGATWGAPTRIGPPNASRPDIAQEADGRLVATWDASLDIFAATSGDAGRTWSAPVRLDDAEASATHPRLLRTDGGVRAFWTESRPRQAARWATRLVP